jgi:hypothetical protein
MKNIIFLFFTIVFAIAMPSCKKNTKPLSSLDYYIENTFSDSVKMNVKYQDYYYQDTNGNNVQLTDTTLTLLVLKGKERKFITSAKPTEYGGLITKHPLLPERSYPVIRTLYGVRANGDTIRPLKLTRDHPYYYYTDINNRSLSDPIYWQKDINEDTGAAVYTLFLR